MERRERQGTKGRLLGGIPVRIILPVSLTVILFGLTIFLLLLLVHPQTLAADHCAVLQYHHISEDTPGITSVTPEQFQQHLDYLLQNDYAVIPLETVITALKTGAELPDRCVALSIDDVNDQRGGTLVHER